MTQGTEPKKSTKERKPRTPKPRLSDAERAKAEATERGEPYVAVLSVEMDPNNVHQGAFCLDWNDKFLANLIRAGYRMRADDTDADIVDRWFQNVCRHVAMETWEQEQAMNPDRIVQSRNLGNGRREVS